MAQCPELLEVASKRNPMKQGYHVFPVSPTDDIACIKYCGSHDWRKMHLAPVAINSTVNNSVYCCRKSREHWRRKHLALEMIAFSAGDEPKVKQNSLAALTLDLQ